MRVSARNASGAPNRPTGAQHEIAAGPHHCVVTEVGATLREYSCDGRALVAGFDVGQRSTSGRGQLLAPWPNRIRDGRYEFDGHDHQLPVDEPARSNAIHGLVRWSPWTRRDGTDSSVTLEHTIYPRDGYPFLVALRVTYSLDADSGLSVHVNARNAGSQPCPFAFGAHPYLRAGSAPVDDWEVELAASTRLLTDDRAIPVGREPVEGTAFDFRRPRPIGATVLDTCFTDL